MERLYRYLLLALFIVGFVGAVSGIEYSGPAAVATVDSSVSLIKDVRLAQEINNLNEGRLMIEGQEDMNEKTLTRVEQVFSQK